MEMRAMTKKIPDKNVSFVEEEVTRHRNLVTARQLVTRPNF